MYRILEFFELNPRANAIEAMRKFENELEVTEHVKVLKNEFQRASAIKKSLRVLYAQRRDVDEKMKYLMSDIEMEIFLEFPPRKGSDAQRENMRMKLKRENVNYMELEENFKGFTMQIDDLEDQYKDLEIEVKTARRMTELFKVYAEFITEYSKGM